MRARLGLLVLATLPLSAIIVPVLPSQSAAADPGYEHAPYSNIYYPRPGSRLTVGEPVTVAGYAVNGESGGVNLVEVSTDGGATWNYAGTGEGFSYTFTPTEPGKIQLVSRGYTQLREIPDHTNPVIVEPDDTFDSLGCPCELWFNSTDYSPALDADDQPVELGVRFRSGSDGLITGVSFLKYPENSGTHVGRLWTEDGTLLAEATFTDETDSGWQQVTFAQPVPVQAGQIYLASYYTPSGHYASTENYFSGHDFTAAPLATQRLGPDADYLYTGPGMYRYGEGGGFPVDGWHDSNYWVTPVFTAPVSTAP
jgi:hypothetical protein